MLKRSLCSLVLCALSTIALAQGMRDRPEVPSDQLQWESSVAELIEAIKKKWLVIRSNPLMAERLSREYQKNEPIIFAPRRVENWNCVLEHILRIGDNNITVVCRGESIRYILLMAKTQTNVEGLSLLRPDEDFILFTGEFIGDATDRGSFFTEYGTVVIVATEQRKPN